jgi:hypothetical protein
VIFRKRVKQAESYQPCKHIPDCHLDGEERVVEYTQCCFGVIYDTRILVRDRVCERCHVKYVEKRPIDETSARIGRDYDAKSKKENPEKVSK